MVFLPSRPLLAPKILLGIHSTWSWIRITKTKIKNENKTKKQVFLAFELQNLCLLLKVRFGIWVDIDFFTCVVERDSGQREV